MTELAQTLQSFLLIAVPIVSAVGALVASWTAIRARRTFYDEYMKTRGRIDD